MSVESKGPWKQPKPRVSKSESKPKGVEPAIQHTEESKPRDCRMCMNKFQSENYGHRICDECRNGSVWQGTEASRRSTVLKYGEKA